MHGMETRVYELTLLEVGWGCGLIALTMVVHAVGMVVTLKLSRALKSWVERRFPAAPLITPLILGAWVICLFHLLEVGVWAAFLVWKNLFTATSPAYAFALMTYTTLGSRYSVSLDWRVLEGMLAMAGLMTFAWSTGVLMTIAQDFQARHVRAGSSPEPDAAARSRPGT